MTLTADDPRGIVGSDHPPTTQSAAAPSNAPRRYRVRAASAQTGVCAECGLAFRARRATREFCSHTCRKAYSNRRMIRGAALYDLLMALRFDRDHAQASGVWSLMCRMAARFRAEDERDRNGRKSWDDVAVVRQRHPQLNAVVLDHNIAGARRRGGRS